MFRWELFIGVCRDLGILTSRSKRGVWWNRCFQGVAVDFILHGMFDLQVILVDTVHWCYTRESHRTPQYPSPFMIDSLNCQIKCSNPIGKHSISFSTTTTTITIINLVLHYISSHFITYYISHNIHPTITHHTIHTKFRVLGSKNQYCWYADLLTHIPTPLPHIITLLLHDAIHMPIDPTTCKEPSSEISMHAPYLAIVQGWLVLMVVVLVSRLSAPLLLSLLL